MGKILDTITGALSGARSEIDTLRTRIAALSAERAAILAAPCPLPEAKAKLDAAINAVAASWSRPAVGIFAGHHPAAGFNPTHWLGSLADSQPAIAALFSEQLKAVLGADLAAHYKDAGKPISAAERAKRLGDIEAALFQAEVAEEGLIMSAESVGIEVERRADASPAAVLYMPAAEAA